MQISNLEPTSKQKKLLSSKIKKISNELKGFSIKQHVMIDGAATLLSHKSNVARK